MPAQISSFFLVLCLVQKQSKNEFCGGITTFTVVLTIIGFRYRLKYQVFFLVLVSVQNNTNIYYRIQMPAQIPNFFLLLVLVQKQRKNRACGGLRSFTVVVAIIGFRCRLKYQVFFLVLVSVQKQSLRWA